MHVITDCGHRFNTGYTASDAAGAMIDCRVCDELLIFPRETTIGTCVRARLFHSWMNEQDVDWPRNGINTYSINI